jgi:serine kinase of HPr protein (carbohydrate metabolism regulator)
VTSNLHATAVVIGDRGVLIRGPSGSGKTTLALAMIAWFRGLGRFACLVADDQVLLSRREGRLLCAAPPSIEGLVEVRGATPRPVRHEPSAIIDLLVILAQEHAAPRFLEERWEEIGGCRVAVLVLAQRNAEGAFPAIAARLSLPPFD